MIDLTDYDAILVVSYGGPMGPDDVLPFMRNATAGRGVPDERLREVSTHYERYGGVSPINACNAQLVDDLRTELARRGCELPVVLGNRNWHPFVTDTLRELHAAGRHRILLTTTAAYASYSGCRQYREDVGAALATLAAEGIDTSVFTIHKTRAYYGEEGFLVANVDALVAAAADLPADDAECRIVFVTHSIPQGMQDASGPSPELRYVAQHEQVAERVASRANAALGRDLAWDLVYCSRSGAPHHPWLEPDVNDHLAALPEAGVTAVVVAPIGFISDHMEVVNDLDFEAANSAAEAGLAFSRAATAGTHPAFISSLVDVLAERAQIARGQRGQDERWSTPCAEGCCLARPGYEPLPALS